MAISPARRVAFDVLQGVEEQQAYASDLLRAKLGSVGDAEEEWAGGETARGVDARDAALATEITLGVLRQRAVLDLMVETLAKRKITALDVEVRIALRMGLYQLRYLERVPASAAVNESVELVKHARKRSAAPLVNAVLRKVDRQPAAWPDRATELSLPLWLLEKW